MALPANLSKPPRSKSFSKDQLRSVAIESLVRVAKDRTAPAAAVAAAARTLLESIGDIGRLQEVARQAEKPPTEMTSREIAEEIERLKKLG
jgi:hypothetical protein